MIEANAKLIASGPPSSVNSSQSPPPNASALLSMKTPAPPPDPRPRLHHRQGRFQGTTGAGQPDVHRVAGHDRQLVIRWGPTARRFEDRRKLNIWLPGEEFNCLPARAKQS